jgi:hypothetical protein
MRNGKRNKPKPVGQSLKVLDGGFGVSKVPQILCFANAFPSEIQVGNWFCLHGDGFSHGVVNGTPVASGLFTAVGSPTTQTISTLPSGANGSLVTQQVVSNSNTYATSNGAGPTGSFSLGVVSDVVLRAANQELVDHHTTAAKGVLLQWQQTRVTAATDDGATTTANGPTFTDQGGNSSHVFTFSYAGAGASNTGIVYTNGTAGTPSAVMRPPSAQAGLPWRLASQSDGTTTSSQRIRAAFLTEKVLSAATVQLMSDYATGKISGSRGEALTFTRATVATAQHENGTVVKLPPGRPAILKGGILIEPAATNLALQSEALATSPWAVSASPGTLTPTNSTADFLAPDGTQTATKLAMPAVTSATEYGVIYQNVVLTAASYNYSIWLRTASGSYSTNLWVTTGASAQTPLPVTVTSTWTRFTLPITGTAATYTARLGADGRAPSSTGNVAAGTIYAWGAQVELGNVATSYIPTTTAAVTRNAATLTATSAIRTNLALQSQALATSPWANTENVAGVVTVTNNSADVIAPDGTQTATKLELPAVANSGATEYAEVYQQSLTRTAATWTDSIWLRTATGTATVNLFSFSSGTDTISTPCTVTTAWQRFSLTGARTAATWWMLLGSNRAITPVTPGISAQTIYAWGAQVELGSTATPYMPTTTAATSALANGMNDYQGAVSCEALEPVISTTVFERLVNFGSNSVLYYGGSATIASCYDGTTTATVTGVPSMTNRWAKFKSWWSTPLGKFAVGVDGTDGAQSNYDSALIQSGTITIGGGGQSNPMSGIIKNIRFYKTKK